MMRYSLFENNFESRRMSDIRRWQTQSTQVDGTRHSNWKSTQKLASMRLRLQSEGNRFTERIETALECAALNVANRWHRIICISISFGLLRILCRVSLERQFAWVSFGAKSWHIRFAWTTQSRYKSRAKCMLPAIVFVCACSVSGVHINN